jgi:pimeloyl-ACP methyl ester carboxylesterase
MRFSLLLACILAGTWGEASSSAVSPLSYDSGTLVLSQELMELTHAAAALSRLTFVDDPEGEAAAQANSTSPTSSSMSWKRFQVFQEEPDLAIVAKQSGRCFAVFRGTVNDGPKAVADWIENLDVTTEQVCWVDDAAAATTSSYCCGVKNGFLTAYNNGFRDDLVKAIRECAADCTNANECVVLAGHSQGGAIAAIAALHLGDLNPYVITFGKPPAIDAPCPMITSSRWFRYVNTAGGGGGTNDATADDDGVFSTGTAGIAYDIVPFVPELGSAAHFGHMIVLGNDPTGVVYVGLDAQTSFYPVSVRAHGIATDLGSDSAPGYLDRIQALQRYYDSQAPYPVRQTGYGAGSVCTQDVECESNRCERDGWTIWAHKRCAGSECDDSSNPCSTGDSRCEDGLCVPKLSSCQACDEDSDCQSGKCGWNRRCAGDSTGLMDDLCFCATGSDCRSGRCEGIVPRVCQPRLNAGAFCTEDNDCVSNQCSWLFRCVDNDGGGDVSASSSNSTVTQSSRSTTSRSVELLGRSELSAQRRNNDRILKHTHTKVVVRDDDADRVRVDEHDDDDDKDESESPNPFRKQAIIEWCLFGLVAAAVSVFVASYCCTAAAGRRRAALRGGYETIPTELTV